MRTAGGKRGAWLVVSYLLFATLAVFGDIGADKPAGKVLLIGGTYFLGKSVAKALLAAGYKVTFITRGSEHQAIAELEQLGAIHVKADRHGVPGGRDALAFANAIGSESFWDAVVDMIACTPDSVASLVNGMDVPGVRKYKFGLYIFVSTTASYVRCATGTGQTIHGKSPLTSETVESDLRDDSLCTHHVRWPYAVNKWNIDKMLRVHRERDVQAGRSDPLPFVTVLIPSMVGSHARDGGELDTRHYELQLLVERCDDIRLHSRHNHLRKYRHLAHDGHMAGAIVGILGAGKVVHGEALNIAMAESLSVEEYLGAIAQALGLAMPRVTYSDHGWDGGGFFNNDPESNWGPLSIEHAQKLIGYSPAPLHTWMNETAQWWATHGKKLHKDEEWKDNMYSKVLKGACAHGWYWRSNTLRSEL